MSNSNLTNVSINLLDPANPEATPVRLAILESTDLIGDFLENNSVSIVSLDEDLANETGYYAVVALDEEDTIDEESDLAMATKLEIALELEDLDDDLFPVEVDMWGGEGEGEWVKPVPFTPPATITKKEFNRKQKESSATAKKKAHMHLFEMIKANPGITRLEIFASQSLRDKLLDPLQQAKINSSDKLEIKRWNRRLNRFLRQIKRDGNTVSRTVEGVKAAGSRAIRYELENTQLPLDFGPQNDVTVGAITRGDEAPDQVLDFDALLESLDNEAVGIA
tara:strand:- start:1828 stop:2664 length:837 start_codon:yes stop_codon:yes gene_type:complete